MVSAIIVARVHDVSASSPPLCTRLSPITQRTRRKRTSSLLPSKAPVGAGSSTTPDTKLNDATIPKQGPTSPSSAWIYASTPSAFSIIPSRPM
ncbi:hypothetical protein L227DRAFT_394724 [Lentinus tigrinus ALCF2SS1-6]|uniref:Uncharacterized protein n=1 Tax=Lentinus tigrinus ALCF2SS1-6 TaxID=1328759 RepID=A0A5C2SIV2_9APHY|nr:hypothetical protein L227DRAFT_394724 [Lentinus tigrinus ALCF2SS1-6]